jgi:hypothetical protein
MLPIVENIYFARKYLIVQNKNKIKSVQNNPVLRYKKSGFPKNKNRNPTQTGAAKTQTQPKPKIF